MGQVCFRIYPKAWELAQYGGNRVARFKQAMLEQAYFNLGRNKKRSCALAGTSEQQKFNH